MVVIPLGFGLREATAKYNRTVLGKPTEEGESPVGEIQSSASSIQSISGHEESGEKTGGPSSKPKYYLMTDRGAVL